jgi:hypothetical protein
MFAASKTSRIATTASDPFFDNVTLLLEGTGTNGAQNNTFIDASTNNFTVTRNGNTTQGAVSPYGENWSGFFDGTGDFLTVASNAAFGFGTGDFTVEFWVFPLASTRQDWIDITNGTQRVLLYYTGTNIVFFSAAPGSTVITGPAITLNAWAHIALSKQAGSTKLFINGTQVGSTYATSQNYGTANSVTIGKDSAGTTVITGYMSNVRVVKGTALYTANFTPSTTPLQPVAGTSLLTCKGPNFVDDSANQFTVTRNGDVSTRKFGPFAGTTLTTPYFGAYFGTKTNSLSIPATTALTTFTGDFTFECWVYPTDATISTSWGIWDSRQSGATANPMIFYLSPLASPVSGSWRLTYYNGTTYNGTGVVLVNQWSHVAFVRSGSTLTFYVNGVAGGTATVSGTQTGNATTNPVFIGSKDSGLANYGTVGHISNFRIVNGTAVYTANFTPSTVPLTAIANTSLLACQSNTFIDNSTNNFAITVVGSTRPTTFAPFAVTYSSLQSYTPAVFGGGMFFDGTGDYLSLTPNVSLTLPGDYTIELWVYFTSLDTNERISANCWNTGAGWLMSTQTSTWNFKTAGSLTLAYSAVAPAAGQWYHLAATRSGSATNNVTFFINGIQVAQGTNTSTLTPAATSTGCVVGAGQGGTGQNITGHVSGFRVVKGTALYTSSFVPQNTPLTAVTNTSLLLNGINAGIYDAATMSDFETVGNAQVSTSVKKYGTSSIALDGTGDYLIAASTPFNPVLAIGTANFTIEFWFYANSSTGTQQLFDTRPTGTSSTAQYMVLTYLSGSLNYYTATSNPAISGGAVTAAVWNYVALTRSGTSTRLFVNGVQVGSTLTDSQSYLIGINRPIIGTEGNSPGTSSFNGYIQDLRITRGIARYTTTFTPPTAPLPSS